jgi:hypothetical protein
MKQLFLFTTLLLLAGLAVAQPKDRGFKLMKDPTNNPTGEKRKAVVIGMSDYGGDKTLPNTLNDANDMADAFTKLGFEVTLLQDNDLRHLKTNLSNWYNTIEGNDMAIFYFAGHGMEVKGENYLIPVDAELNSETDVEDYTLKVSNVLGNMDEKRVGFKLIILDACRDNPFTRGWRRGTENNGLTGIPSAPKGTLIAFPAASGKTAADGGTYALRNGVFTHFLKKQILTPGISIMGIFTRVSNEVDSLTNGQQTPFTNSSLTKTFFFIPRGDNPTPYNPPPEPTPVVVNTKRNGAVWNPDGMELVDVEGTGSGAFGSPGFYRGKYEVTQAQYKAIMGNNPSYVKGDNLPVEQVSWNDAQEFIKRLNAKTGRNYRLPTEAEWESAAGGGTLTHNYDYSGSNSLDNVAWNTDNSGGRTHTVGTKAPNELGIYDMSGNVYEWCEDLSNSSGSNRVLRGGGWYNVAALCRVSDRHDYTPDVRSGVLGFRLAYSSE